jgi:hypothetical protein
MAQYGFNKENGHSFPESFVPCAYSYYWNPAGEYSLGKLLSEAGVKYANTDFSQIPELNPPQEINGGGFDFSTHVINRINYGNVWYELNSLPKVPVEQQQTDIIESHWANWLAQDDFLQPDVTAKWIRYYKDIQQRPDRYIAKNTEQLHSQWLYKKYTKITEARPGVVEIDNTQMPSKAYLNGMLGNLVLKIRLEKNQHISYASLQNNPISGYFEDEGFAYIYLPPLQKKNYVFTYVISDASMPLYIFNDGTYNVYEVFSDDTNLTINVKVYGTQVIKIKCAEPKTIVAEINKLVIRNYSYASESGELQIHVHAPDMQGTLGKIFIRF